VDLRHATSGSQIAKVNDKTVSTSEAVRVEKCEVHSMKTDGNGGD
jgi:hypothetical protein